ncbi:AMP-binding protein [Chloroflexota bacterium]
MEGVKSYPEEAVKEYQEKGWWIGTTLIDAFNRTCDIYPEKEAVIEVEQGTRFTFSQIREMAHKVALAFLELGIKKGDFVLLQIPNWSEAIYTQLGLDLIGVIPVLCLPRHGRRELEGFCALTRAVAWIGPAMHRGIDYVSMARTVRENTSYLQHLVVVRGDTVSDTLSFSRLTERIKPDESAITYLNKFKPSPNDVLQLSPTGGTTGFPKLVPKTHNMHLSKAYYWARTLERGPKDVDLIAMPVNHDAAQTSVIAPFALFGSKLVLQASTRVKDILESMEKEGVTFYPSVPALVNDLVNEPDLEKYDLLPELLVCIGGAYAPPELIEAANEKLKCRLSVPYGSTEGVACDTIRLNDFDAIMRTVGRPVCPYDEYKIMDEEGHELPQGQEGEIACRGPSFLSGYYKSEEEDKLAFTKDGFFRTGDIGRFDKQGNLTITGRKKDLIKRGGETIIPSEIEELITRHPKISQVAVVGMPDPRLGEKACAYIQPVPGGKISFDEIISFLKAQGASLLLLPERVEVVTELPLTDAGKADKQVLKLDIAQKLAAEKVIS